LDVVQVAFSHDHERYVSLLKVLTAPPWKVPNAHFGVF
jgi:hypothetical protein